MDRKQLLRASQIAVELFGDKRESWRVYRWLREGGLPGFRSGSTWYVPAEAYRAWRREKGLDPGS
jgi:hypothetical protein